VRRCAFALQRVLGRQADPVPFEVDGDDPDPDLLILGGGVLALLATRVGKLRERDEPVDAVGPGS
jgi:hypothetical protein